MSDDTVDIHAQLDSSFTIEVDGPKVTISIQIENMPIPVTHMLREKSDEVARRMYEGMFSALNGIVRSHDKKSEYVSGKTVVN